MEPTIQKIKMPGWKKGARIGAFVGFLLSLLAMTYIAIISDGIKMEPFKTFVQISVVVCDASIVGFCLGGLVGRFLGKESMPYRFKFAFAVTIIPVLFLTLTMLDPHLEAGVLIVMVYLIFGPIPLFIAGSLIGAFVDAVIRRKHPSSDQVVAVQQSGRISKFFKFFLKP